MLPLFGQAASATSANIDRKQSARHRIIFKLLALRCDASWGDRRYRISFDVYDADIGFVESFKI